MSVGISRDRGRITCVNMEHRRDSVVHTVKLGNGCDRDVGIRYSVYLIPIWIRIYGDLWDTGNGERGRVGQSRSEFVCFFYCTTWYLLYDRYKYYYTNIV